MKLPGWLAENFRLKVFAFLLTLLVYGVVVSGRSYERDLYFTVAVDGIPEDQVVVSELPEVRVRLAATRGGFSGLGDASRRVIRVPLPPAGKRQIHLSDSDLPLPRGVKALSMTPESFNLRLEKLVTRNLPVRAEAKGTPGGGHQVLSVRAIPEKVQVRAPQSVFAALSTLNTEPVNVDGRDEDFSTRVRIEADLPFVSLSPDAVDVSVDLGSEAGSRLLSKVSVQLLGPRADRVTLNRNSLQVKLRGPRAVVEKLAPDDLFATVDLMALPSQLPGTYAVVPQVNNLPAEVEVQSVWPETLRLTLR